MDFGIFNNLKFTIEMEIQVRHHFAMKNIGLHLIIVLLEKLFEVLLRFHMF
jgi:hypothetical protein